MRVHEDDGGGGQLQRAPRKRAWIDRRMIHRAAPDNRVGDQLVLGAEIGDARLLVLLVAPRQHHVVEQDRPVGDDRSVLNRIARRAASGGCQCG